MPIVRFWLHWGNGNQRHYRQKVCKYTINVSGIVLDFVLNNYICRRKLCKYTKIVSSQFHSFENGFEGDSYNNNLDNFFDNNITE